MSNQVSTRALPNSSAALSKYPIVSIIASSAIIIIHTPGGIAAQMTKQARALYTNMQKVELMLVKTHVENQVL
jgi:hypothetical protein